jgi:hypothetical protein
MSNMYFEDHPTDPDKVILRKPRYEDDDDIQDYKKPWVGLTDMERQMIINKHEGVAWETAIAIEQALKEKNV